MICPKCGRTNGDNGSFCSGCGYNLEPIRERRAEQSNKLQGLRALKDKGIITKAEFNRDKKELLEQLLIDTLDE